MPFQKERLKTRRLEIGKTLRDVAEDIGVRHQTIHRYENGAIEKIDTTTIEKLARAVQCSPAFLMGWQDEVSGFDVLEDKTNNQHIKHNTKIFEFNSEEKQIIQNYRTLNQDGKERLFNTSDELNELKRYQI